MNPQTPPSLVPVRTDRVKCEANYSTVCARQPRFIMFIQIFPSSIVKTYLPKIEAPHIVVLLYTSNYRLKTTNTENAVRTLVSLSRYRHFFVNGTKGVCISM